jgi:hypothetical protein
VAAVDVKRATDFYALGWTLRQIGAELGLTETTLSDHLLESGRVRRADGPSTVDPTSDLRPARSSHP